MTAADLRLEKPADRALTITLSGDWLLAAAQPDTESALAEIDAASEGTRVALDASGLGAWDSRLLIFLVALHRRAEARGLGIDSGALPDGVRRLLGLASAVKEPEGARRSAQTRGFFEEIGTRTLVVIREAKALLDFFGTLALSFNRLFRGKASCFRRDVMLQIQQAGAEALPIVSVISLLIGMIFAFVGVMQLAEFGAGIYTADLVAVAMVREIAAIMTAIIMAGRTGAAYAAEIGTMKVNEEIDALTTLGLDTVDYLVTPRVIALVLMMPLLTLYSSLMGILGGAGVGMVMLDVSLLQYTEQTVRAVDFDNLFGGLFKSVVYGALVAMAGCLQGMACGDSAMAVGVATTKAVVMSIVLIVVSASILTIIYINLGI